MSAPLTQRPTPIRDAFKSVGAAIAVVGTLVNTLVSLGVITAAQGTAVENFVAIVPAVLELGVFVLVAFGVVRRAEPQVTPLSDPATLAFDPLANVVRLVPLEIPEDLRAA